MSNPSSEKNSVEKRISRVRKTISRTVQTAPYESLVIEDGIDEAVEWSSLAEYDKKNKNWETILIQRYKGFYDKVCTELGLSHKVAFFKNPSEETKVKYQKVREDSNKNPNSNVSPSLNLDDLDDLDTLGG